MAEAKAEVVHNAPVVSGTNQADGRPATWFKPGQSGNPAGRPKGIRQQLDNVFVLALYHDFKEGGVEAIRKCREDKPDVYLNVIAKVIPKQVEIDATDAAADLAKGLHAVADFLSSFANDQGSAHHAGIVSDGPVLSPCVRAQAH